MATRVRRHARNDSPLGEPGDDVGRVASLDVEADEAGGERSRPGRVHGHAREAREPLPQPGDQRADPGFDPCTANPLVERERLAQRPSVLERVEASRRQPCAVGDTAGCSGPPATRRSSHRRRRREWSDARAREPADPPRERRFHVGRTTTCGSPTRTRRSQGSVQSRPQLPGRAPRRRTPVPGRAARPRSGAAAASRPCSNAPTSGPRRAFLPLRLAVASSRSRPRRRYASRRTGAPAGRARRIAGVPRAWRRSRARSSGPRPVTAGQAAYRAGRAPSSSSR